MQTSHELLFFIYNTYFKCTGDLYLTIINWYLQMFAVFQLHIDSYGWFCDLIVGLVWIKNIIIK